MRNFQRLKGLLLKISSKKLTAAGIVTGALAVVFCCVTAYYYFSTPPNTILITTADLPPGVASGFNVNNLTDHVAAHLHEMIRIADTGELRGPARQEGLGPRPAKQALLPIRAFSNSPSPIFNLKWKGLDLNLCRSLGMSLRAKGFLELAVVSVPQGGWSLMAMLKEAPQYQPESSGAAPRGGGACTDLEKCAHELAEQILKSLDERRLLSYYIKQANEEANRRILDLYQSGVPAASLNADDLVAWGNAFYALGRYDEAQQKFREALEKDGSSCAAQVALGFVYYSKARAPRKLPDLQRAEEYFRKGIACDPGNEFTQTSLCHTLLQEWLNSKSGMPLREDRVLVEAREHCEKALEINPQFVRAGINKSYILYQQGKHEEALRYFDELSQRYPTESALFLNHGYFLFREYLKDSNKETLKRATAQTLKAWELNQKSDIAANNLGYFYYELGDYPKAVEFWKEALALKPDDPDGLTGLALGTYKLGDREAAIRYLSNAVQLDAAYCNPDGLKQSNTLTRQAASDLTELISGANQLCRTS